MCKLCDQGTEHVFLLNPNPKSVTRSFHSNPKPLIFCTFLTNPSPQTCHYKWNLHNTQVGTENKNKNLQFTTTQKRTHSQQIIKTLQIPTRRTAKKKKQIHHHRNYRRASNHTQHNRPHTSKPKSYITKTTPQNRGNNTQHGSRTGFMA